MFNCACLPPEGTVKTGTNTTNLGCTSKPQVFYMSKLFLRLLKAAMITFDVNKDICFGGNSRLHGNQKRLSIEANSSTKFKNDCHRESFKSSIVVIL